MFVIVCQCFEHEYRQLLTNWYEHVIFTTDHDKHSKGETMKEKDTILTLAQAADQLGVSTRTLMRFMEKGDIKGFMIGNRWKFLQSEINAYLTRQQEGAGHGESKSVA
jgi:excisionase family DNA binding protein